MTRITDFAGRDTCKTEIEITIHWRIIADRHPNVDMPDTIASAETGADYSIDNRGL